MKQQKFTEALARFLDTRETLAQAKAHNTSVVPKLEKKLFLAAYDLDKIVQPGVALQPENQGFGYSIELQTSTQNIEPKQVMQYYYKTNDCKAKSSSAKSCICWHDEGTGLHKAERFSLHHRFLKWREKPVQAAAADVRVEESVPTTRSDIVDHLHRTSSMLEFFGLDGKSLYRDAAFEIDKLRQALLAIREACGLRNLPLTEAIAETCDSALGEGI